MCQRSQYSGTSEFKKYITALRIQRAQGTVMSDSQGDEEENPDLLEEAWIGQAPLDVYLEVHGLARGGAEAARVADFNWDTFEILGEIGHLAFLRRVAHELHYNVGPFTVDLWWETVQERGHHVLMAAKIRKSSGTRQSPGHQDTPSFGVDEAPESHCETILRAWNADPPPVRRALAQLTEIGGAPNTDGFRCVVRLIWWLSEKHLGSPADIRLVAHAVVAAYLRGAESIGDLKNTAERGQSHASQYFNSRFSEIVLNQIRHNIVLLLNSRESIAVSKLSKNLRKYGRPDLSVEATADFTTQEDGWDIVWTSRAAALADLYHLDESLGLCRTIWASRPKSAVCTVMSRTLRLKRNNDESHKWALEGWGLSEDAYTARTLAASSVLVGDTKHLQDAASLLKWSEGREGEGEGDQVDPYVLVKAGWLLLGEGSIEQAHSLATQVLEDFNGYRRAGALLGAANREAALRRMTS